MKSRHQGKVLFKILGVIAGLVFVVAGFNENSELSRIQKLGKRATVEPIGQYTQFKQGSSSIYTAEFHFTTEDGRQIVTKHSFPEEVLAEFKAHKPVQVVYLPSDPSTFVFAGAQQSWWLTFIGAMLAVAALILA
jgi:hypothetical protein